MKRMEEWGKSDWSSLTNVGMMAVGFQVMTKLQSVYYSNERAYQET